MQLSKQAILQINDLTNEASRLAQGSGSDRKQADVLLTKVANIRSCGLSSDELRGQYTAALVEKLTGTAAQERARHEVFFRRYVQSKTPQQRTQMIKEFRDGVLQAGAQAITYTEGASGGVLVPNSFYDAVVVGMAQTDPLLDAKNVNLLSEQTYAMNPKSLPGYDLTQIKAVRVVENTSTGVPDPLPSSSSQILSGYPYRMATYATVEFGDDDFENSIITVGRAHGVGLARGIGADLVNGTGSGQPTGLLTGASNSGYTTAGANTITATDINDIFFAVNRIYRNSPKCA